MTSEMLERLDKIEQTLAAQLKTLVDLETEHKMRRAKDRHWLFPFDDQEERKHGR